MEKSAPFCSVGRWGLRSVHARTETPAVSNRMKGARFVTTREGYTTENRLLVLVRAARESSLFIGRRENLLTRNEHTEIVALTPGVAHLPAKRAPRRRRLTCLQRFSNPRGNFSPVSGSAFRFCTRGVLSHQQTRTIHKCMRPSAPKLEHKCCWVLERLHERSDPPKMETPTGTQVLTYRGDEKKNQSTGKII